MITFASPSNPPLRSSASSLLIHNPVVAFLGELRALWQIYEVLKGEGKLNNIGMSSYRVLDLEAILDGAKHKPVVGQVFGFIRKIYLY